MPRLSQPQPRRPALPRLLAQAPPQSRGTPATASGHPAASIRAELKKAERKVAEAQKAVDDERKRLRDDVTSKLRLIRKLHRKWGIDPSSGNALRIATSTNDEDVDFLRKHSKEKIAAWTRKQLRKKIVALADFEAHDNETQKGRLDYQIDKLREERDSLPTVWQRKRDNLLAKQGRQSGKNVVVSAVVDTGKL